MTTIEIENVTRVFGRSRPEAEESRGEVASPGTSALDGVNLTVPAGQTCAVVGPSGCGKSTLLRVVAGLDGDYTGRVAYDGRDMRGVPPGERNIGMVFQNYALYPHFHGGGNLRFFFRVRRAPDAEAEERIRATAQIMGYGFNQLLGHKPGTLSGGQQQRLAIARALVRNPDLFLFDEPLSSLDAKLRSQTRVEIRRLLQRFAITTLYVTHDQEEAIALGDLIAVMRAGRVEQVGTHAELYHEPVNAFVAGFLGRYPMNLLAGRVNTDASLALGGVDLPLPGSVATLYRSGQTLLLGARPEGLGLAANLEAEGCNLLSGTVESIEPDFARRVQYVRVQTVAGVVTVADPGMGPLADGEAVAIRFDEEQLLFFDRESGRRVPG